MLDPLFQGSTWPFGHGLSSPFPSIVFWRRSELPPSQPYVIGLMAALMDVEGDQAFP